MHSDKTTAMVQAETLRKGGASLLDIASAFGLNVAKQIFDNELQKHGDHDQSSHGNRYGYFRADEASKKLADGKVVSSKSVGKGINKPSVVELDNGVKAIEKVTTAKGQEGFYAPIAYNIATDVGFDNVPATVLLDDDKTTRQEFVPNADSTFSGFTEKKMSKMYDEGAIDKKSAQQIAILDFLMHSNDRHGGNVMLDKNGKVWAIDNDTYSDNSRAAWKGERKGFSKAMAGKEVDSDVLQKLEKWADRVSEDSSSYKGHVPDDVLKSMVRRAKYIVKTGVIP